VYKIQFSKSKIEKLAFSISKKVKLAKNFTTVAIKICFLRIFVIYLFLYDIIYELKGVL